MTLVQDGCYFIYRTQFNPDEQWTKAVKYLLTNLKWALTWVSAPVLTQAPPASGSPGAALPTASCTQPGGAGPSQPRQ